jgi:hypothetical protein
VAACAHSLRALDLYQNLLASLDREALSQARHEMDAIEAQRVIHDLLVRE